MRKSMPKSFFLFLLFAFLSPLSAYSEKGNYALVIIDMQRYFITRSGFDQDPKNQEKIKKVIEAQIQAIKLAKRANVPIIFIEYEHEEVKDKTEAALKEAASGYEKVKYMSKTTDGMLDGYNIHGKELAQYLKDNDINTLIVAGANGGACVQFSIDGALSKNYSVIALSKGIADFNYQEFIYPYDDIYKYNQLSCADCTFREADDFKNVFPGIVHPLTNSGGNQETRTTEEYEQSVPGR